jgi:hypothetical protein
MSSPYKVFWALAFIAAAALPLAPAYAQSVAVSIQNVVPGTVLSAGTRATFSVVAAGFTNPTYSLSDSFSGSTVNNSDINSSGIFTWTPASSDQGTHNITVSISDSQGHVASVAVQFTIASAYVTIGALSPSASVAAGATVSFYASLTGFSNPSFALSDNFSGSTLRSTNINSSGFFSWTPTTADAGSHTITVLAFDSSGHSANASTIVTVGAGSNVSLGSVSPSATVSPGTLVSFSASATNFSNPAFTVSDGFNGTTVTSGDISSSGDFTWTPTSSDIGTHSLTVTAYDTQGHTGSVQVVITVAPAGSTPAVSSAASTIVSSAAAPASGGYVFTEYLAPGSQDAEVLQLQELLQRQGYLAAAPTGYYGAATESAVMKFQTAHGLNALGVVGPSTRVALNQTGGVAVAPSSSAGGTVSPQLLQELSAVEQLLQQIEAQIQKMKSGQ